MDFLSKLEKHKEDVRVHADSAGLAKTGNCVLMLSAFNVFLVRQEIWDLPRLLDRSDISSEMLLIRQAKLQLKWFSISFNFPLIL